MDEQNAILGRIRALTFESTHISTTVDIGLEGVLAA